MQLNQKNDLTKRQQMVYDFIKDEIRTKGYPPSIREICQAVNLTSTSSVHSHLETLQNKGLIKKDSQKNRCLEILEPGFYSNSGNSVNVPIVGKITAGAPILAIENIEDYFPVPKDYLGEKDAFFLRVSGESMINKGIHDNDLVLIKKQETARNGEIVAALIDDSATLKTFYKESNHFRLQPENPAYEPIIVTELSILGVMIGLFRKY